MIKNLSRSSLLLKFDCSGDFNFLSHSLCRLAPEMPSASSVIVSGRLVMSSLMLTERARCLGLLMNV